MKRLGCLIFLTAHYFGGMELSQEWQPASLKKQCCSKIITFISDGVIDEDQIKKLPKDLVAAIKPHTLTREVMDEQGNVIKKFFIHRTTGDHHYGLLQGEAIGKKDTLYRFDLYTGQKEELGPYQYFAPCELSQSGNLFLYRASLEFGAAIYMLHDLANKQLQAFSIKESTDAYFCGDEHIFFRLRESQTSIYQIKSGSVKRTGKLAIHLPSYDAQIVRISDRECIVDDGNYYYLINYADPLYFYFVPSIRKKWVCKNYAPINTYEPRRLVAFAQDKYKSMVQISNLDDPVNSQKELPALGLIDNEGRVESLCFGNSGNWLIIGSNNHDGQIRIWDWQNCPQKPLIVFNPCGMSTSPLHHLFCNDQQLFFNDGSGNLHTIKLSNDVELLAAGLACQQKMYEKKDIARGHAPTVLTSILPLSIDEADMP